MISLIKCCVINLIESYLIVLTDPSRPPAANRGSMQTILEKGSRQKSKENRDMSETITEQRHRRKLHMYVAVVMLYDVRA